MRMFHVSLILSSCLLEISKAAFILRDIPSLLMCLPRKYNLSTLPAFKVVIKRMRRVEWMQSWVQCKLHQPHLVSINPAQYIAFGCLCVWCFMRCRNDWRICRSAYFWYISKLEGRYVNLPLSKTRISFWRLDSCVGCRQYPLNAK